MLRQDPFYSCLSAMAASLQLVKELEHTLGQVHDKTQHVYRRTDEASLERRHRLAS